MTATQLPRGARLLALDVAAVVVQNEAGHEFVRATV